MLRATSNAAAPVLMSPLTSHVEMFCKEYFNMTWQTYPESMIGHLVEISHNKNSSSWCDVIVKIMPWECISGDCRSTVLSGRIVEDPVVPELMWLNFSPQSKGSDLAQTSWPIVNLGLQPNPINDRAAIWMGIGPDTRKFIKESCEKNSLLLTMDGAELTIPLTHSIASPSSLFERGNYVTKALIMSNIARHLAKE